MQTSRHHRQVKTVIDQIVRDIQRSPGGYTYLSQLPLKGLHTLQNIQNRWVTYVRHNTLPEEMVQAMVKACLTPEGTIDDRGRGLALWLIENVYTTPQTLFSTWLNNHSPINSTLHKSS